MKIEVRTPGFAQMTSQASCGPQGEEGQRHLCVVEHSAEISAFAT